MTKQVVRMEPLLESLMGSDEPLLPPDTPIPPDPENLSESDFWTKLLDIVSVKTHSYPVVESALKDYLLFATKHLSDFLVSDNDLFRAGYKLTTSPIFTLHKAFTRRKLIAMLTLADEYSDLAAVVSLILLIDSDSHPATLEMMQEENACHALTRLLLTFTKTSALRLRRVLLELMFEMCKIQRISISDLENISDRFIDSLLRTVVNADRDDTSLYDASVMKVLLCLNEQYMIAVYDEKGRSENSGNSEKSENSGNFGNSGNSENFEISEISGKSQNSEISEKSLNSKISEKSGNSEISEKTGNSKSEISKSLNSEISKTEISKTQNPENSENSEISNSENSERIFSSKVLDLISLDIDGYVEFGAKLVLLLNRAIDTCLQIMGLKLLYLLFTNEPTYEYFYTNDLLVLIDVFIRELHDLPNDEEQLINTYLRVLHPLMTNSQIRHEPYKIESLTDVLEMLSGHKGSSTFLPVSETTLRLAVRCLGVPWLDYTFPSPISTVPPSPSSSVGSLEETASPTRVRVPSIGITDFNGTRRLSQSQMSESATSSTTSLLSSLKLAPPPPPSRASSKGPPVPPPSRGKSPMPIIPRGKSPAPPPPPSRGSPGPNPPKREKPRLPPSRKKLLDMSIRNTSVGDLSVTTSERSERVVPSDSQRF